MIDCLVDGRAADSVPADDRGLLYGDLLFETMAFHGLDAPLWHLHWARLSRGCERLGLDLPDADIALTECRSLCRPDQSSVIRLVLTRGSGGRAYFPPDESACRRIIQRRAWPARLEEEREQGLSLVTSPIRLAVGSELAGLKHGNRLEQVLAARACRAAGADEAVLFDAQGRVAEAIASNLLVEVDGRVISPHSGAGVDGVGLVWLEQRLGNQIEQAELGAAELAAAEAIMVINSVAGIRPARSLDGRTLTPGRYCRAWQRLWNDELA
jgi:4-amino-4-deoxychorismate lyase